MSEYNHKQFIEWLKGEVTKNDSKDGLLVEAKLSKYWKIRAKRRANDRKREWPNKKDREWALKEQEKSTSMNEKVHEMFLQELEMSEEMNGDIDEMMKHMKAQREQMKLKREQKQKLEHPAKATKRRKGGKSQSHPTKPEHGGVTKGFRKKKGVTVSPAGSFGPNAGAAVGGAGGM